VKSFVALLVFVLLTFAAAATGSAWGPDAWYDALVKPSFNPPNWIFPIVWTPLYAMIAIAGWLLWLRAPRSLAMTLWPVQLALNAAWTWLFFGRHEIGAALADIGLLWLAIGGTIIAAWRHTRAAAWLLVPYWAWVTFAAALNAEFWRLN
jgi:benzodiazapine receptor